MVAPETVNPGVGTVAQRRLNVTDSGGVTTTIGGSQFANWIVPVQHDELHRLRESGDTPFGTHRCCRSERARSASRGLSRRCRSIRTGGLRLLRYHWLIGERVPYPWSKVEEPSERARALARPGGRRACPSCAARGELAESVGCGRLGHPKPASVWLGAERDAATEYPA